MIAFPVFALYLSCAFNLLSLFRIPRIRRTIILPQQPGPPSRLTWASFALAYQHCGHYCPRYFPASFPAPSVPPNTTLRQATTVVVTQIGDFTISTLVASEAQRWTHLTKRAKKKYWAFRPRESARAMTSKNTERHPKKKAPAVPCTVHAALQISERIDRLSPEMSHPKTTKYKLWLSCSRVWSGITQLEFHNCRPRSDFFTAVLLLSLMPITL